METRFRNRQLLAFAGDSSLEEPLRACWERSMEILNEARDYVMKRDLVWGPGLSRYDRRMLNRSKVDISRVLYPAPACGLMADLQEEVLRARAEVMQEVLAEARAAAEGLGRKLNHEEEREIRARYLPERVTYKPGRVRVVEVDAHRCSAKSVRGRSGVYENHLSVLMGVEVTPYEVGAGVMEQINEYLDIPVSYSLDEQGHPCRIEGEPYEHMRFSFTCALRNPYAYHLEEREDPDDPRFPVFVRGKPLDLSQGEILRQAYANPTVLNMKLHGRLLEIRDSNPFPIGDVLEWGPDELRKPLRGGRTTVQQILEKVMVGRQMGYLAGVGNPDFYGCSLMFSRLGLCDLLRMSLGQKSWSQRLADGSMGQDLGPIGSFASPLGQLHMNRRSEVVDLLPSLGIVPEGMGILGFFSPGFRLDRQHAKTHGDLGDLGAPTRPARPARLDVSHADLTGPSFGSVRGRGSGGGPGRGSGRGMRF